MDNAGCHRPNQQLAPLWLPALPLKHIVITSMVPQIVANCLANEQAPLAQCKILFL